MADRGGDLRYLYENWYIHFHKTSDHQIWEADTPKEVYSNKTS